MSKVIELISNSFQSETFAAIASALAGSGAAVLVGLLRRWVTKKRLKEEARAEQFEVAISSDNLAIIGNYLRNDLGKLDLKDYLNDEDTRNKVNRYLKRLDDLVQIPENTESMSEDFVEVGPDEQLSYFEIFGDDPQPVRAAIERINAGEVWTGLAGLRRDIEKQLSLAFPSSDGRKGPPYRNVRDPDLNVMLRRFWFLASKAIHGEDLSIEETSTAVKLARTVYRQLMPVPELP